jgi:hypothetical protein
MCHIWGEELAWREYSNQVNKLIFASANDDGATRLFARSLSRLTDLENKEGWWNTFTLTEQPCDKGTYICRISEVRPDKYGYPIFVVAPLVKIDEHDMDAKLLPEFLMQTGLFTEALYHGFGHFNMESLWKHIDPFVSIDKGSYSFHQYPEVANAAVDLILNGKISCAQVSEWLCEPTEEELRRAAFEAEVEAFFRDVAAYNPNSNDAVISDQAPSWLKEMAASAAEKKAAKAASVPSVDFDKLPLLLEKSKKFAEKNFSTRLRIEFIEDLSRQYQHAVDNGNIEAVSGLGLWYQLEAYLEFDMERKRQQKAAKTAAKKAKKAAAKNA